MRISIHICWVFLASLVLLTGCDWDPPHDNPFDPDNPNYNPTGNLRLKVYPLNWHDAPIPGVTVLITELGRFGITDNNGETFFDQIPADTLMVVAYRDTDPEVIYARDSIEIIIEPSKTTFDSLRLDAVPFFDSAKVNSITVAERGTGEDTTRTFARLTAWVSDPDGEFDLHWVEFRFLNLLRDSLDYIPDSVYWQIEVPSESFIEGDLRNTLTRYFAFEAFDRAENSSQDSSVLARVLNGVPTRLSYTKADTLLVLEWNYALYHQLPNVDSFSYLVRIFTADADQTILYEKKVHPDATARNVDTVDVDIAPGNYRWQVWVIDLYGNMSRSLAEWLTIPL